MTLGQHIQQLRKDKGLSQEALGEFLGVSRQAISKWESDTTIPEIDNLIAMSRLFEIPVGVLLGVEEDDPASPAAEELTDRELAAIEAIVERYLEKARKKPKRRLWLIAAGGAAALLLILLLVFWMKGLSSRMRALQNNVNGISSNVSHSINSMADQIQTILEQEASLLADSSCQVTGVDIAAGTLFLDITVTPKEYTEGMELVFTAEPANAESVTTSGILTSGHTFRAERWEVPLGDPIKLSVSWDSGDSWQTQALEPLYGYSSDTGLELRLHRSGKSYFLRNRTNQTAWFVDWSIEGTFRHQSMTTLEADLTLETAELQLCKNGAVVDSLPLECTADGDTISFCVDEYQKEVPITSEDTLEYGVFYVDNYGREDFYFMVIVSFQDDGSGKLEPVFSDPADDTVVTHWDVTW